MHTRRDDTDIDKDIHVFYNYVILNFVKMLRMHHKCRGNLIIQVTIFMTCTYVYASDWLVFDVQGQTTCSNTTAFQYTTISEFDTYKLSCLKLCGKTEWCFSVIFRNFSSEFGQCVLANTVSGCPPNDVIWYQKVCCEFTKRGFMLY